ncbi:MAG: HAMP domain-containing histidine kinase [Oscillospiraceae bacterium]|jgi:signal transduction histidine kinase|nr:HAMP domain-containing histidine kinase [Oscillospiraceae bacterium]
MDNVRLKWRIFMFLLGFCALLIVMLWLMQTVLLTETYKLIRRMEIREAVALVEKNINQSDLQAIIADLGTEKEILVMPAQEFLVPDRPNPGNPNRRPMESVTETKDFTLSDGRNLSLTFHAIITPMDATISTLRFQLYIISGVMLFCAVVLAVIIARRISKPIEKISEGAKSLAVGRYDTHFTGHGFLEIRELSDTLNIAVGELSQTDNLRRELMANVSHDLRTPLALIYSYAEMMHDFPAEVTPEQTQLIMDESKRLASLVNDILDVSQLEAGVMELHASVYNLTESLSETISRVTELAGSDGYAIHFEHDGERYVNADEIKITQVFYNLLLNAIHYSGDGKIITVRQDTAGNKVRISVIDCGKGITQKNIPHIWERYYRGSETHKRAIAGTGLGLSIVKKIIELHGGTYGVISEQSKGSTFWFELDIA